MIVPAVSFLLALALISYRGEKALRVLFVAIVILAPMRGGLLAIADSLGLSDPSLAVNALIPALVAAFALGVIVVLRPRISTFPSSLLVIWLLIAFVILLNLPFQLVGLKLYAIGVAQYLTYPTFALAAWFLIRPEDLLRVTYLFFGVGVVLASTVLVQASGVESFIQAATAQVDGFAANRFAGSTGSYLHTSSFLGVCAVLGLGLFLKATPKKESLFTGAGLALILSGVVLTFSRSGVMISLIGFALLLVFAAKGKRLSALSIILAAGLFALAVGSWGGATPEEVRDRTTSGLSPTTDAGNQQRIGGIEKGLEASGQLDFVHKVFGEGLAATGNARQLTDGEILAVESYLVKLLVETGFLGVIIVGGILIWAFSVFARSLRRSQPVIISGVGAAGIGLSLYNLIYPALETQLLALTWWTLLLVADYARQNMSHGPTTGDKRKQRPLTVQHSD